MLKLAKKDALTSIESRVILTRSQTISLLDLSTSSLKLLITLEDIR
jgi:hypothetical protein